ncbi:hypothetical protein C0J52_16750, partial [Blattella germanica]
RLLSFAISSFLRSVPGYTILDHQRNEHVHHQLNMPNLNESIKKNKQNWYEHIKIMGKNRIPRKMIDYKPRGHRNVGRPKNDG